MRSNRIKCMISAGFLVFILSMFVIILKGAFQAGISMEAIQEEVEYNIAYKEKWIDLYGAIQNIAGKAQIENFTIFKNNYGKLIEPKARMEDKEIIGKADEVMPLLTYCNDNNISCIYITSVLPVQEKSDLPYMELDYSHENAEVLLDYMIKCGINVFDIRESEAVKAISKEEVFYKTDHHWSMTACFAAFQELIKEIEKQTNCNIDSKYYDLANYYEYRQSNSFLGSYGVKVGKYYAGQDDFVVYVPNFKTYLNFEAYDENGNLVLAKDGEWMSCLMDLTILSDDDYHNKYNSWSNGAYIENHVVNNLADNNLKVLYISHSYGRPMTQYLALCFREVRHLDPQEGRFQGNYLNYMEVYNPDIVIFQGESVGRIIGTYDVSS